MALLKFKKGLYDKLPSERVDGTVYITTDEKAMYVDYLNEETSQLDRIRIGQIVTLTSEEWEAKKPPFSTDVFYYITDLNALVKYNGTTWVQINSTEILRTDINNLKTEVLGADGTGTTSGIKYDVNTLKTKVDGLVSTGGEANLVNDVQVNGTSVVTDKVANITMGALATKDKVAEADLADDVKTKFTTIEGNITTL